MNENINPPCITYAIPCWVKMSSFAEKRATSLFGENVSGTEEKELVIGGDAAARSLFPNSPVILDLSVAASEGEEYVARALREVVMELAVMLIVEQ